MLTEYGRVDIDHNPLGNASQLQAQIPDFRERVHWLRFVAAVPFRGRAHFFGFAPSRRRPASLSSPLRPERTLANHLPLNKSLFNYCVFHARIRIRSFSCFWLRFRVLSNANLLRLLDRWQDTRRSLEAASPGNARMSDGCPSCLPACLVWTPNIIGRQTLGSAPYETEAGYIAGV